METTHVLYTYARTAHAKIQNCANRRSLLLGARHNFLLQFGLEFGDSFFCTLPLIPSPRSLPLMWQISGWWPLAPGGSCAGW